MPDILALWPDGAAGSEDWPNPEQDHVFNEPWSHRVTRNVSNPTLTVYLPEPAKATGTSVIICPGGAHHFLAVDHEGHEVATWLNARGIAGIMLKYRVIQTPNDTDEFLEARNNIPERMRTLLPAHWPLALADGQQAVRIVRQQATAWGLRTDRIGILGFSAGGQLAAGVALASSGETRPDFVAPIYGARWSAADVPADAPPLFTAVASNDQIAARSCLDMFSAWHAAGCSAEIHCYAQGGHGFGMVKQGLPSDGWIERFGEWLAAQGLV